MVDYTVAVGSKVHSGKSIKIESKKGSGWPQFIEGSEVGQIVKVTVNLNLMKEEILDEAVGGVSLARWQLMKKKEAENEKKLEQKLEQKLEKKLEQKLEQKLELKLEQKLEQKLEMYVERKMKQNLNDQLNQLDQKINMKFEDLKEDIKAPARAPECPICFEELKPPMKIIFLNADVEPVQSKLGENDRKNIM